MINKQFKFEGKILNGYIFKKIKPKFWMFRGQFDLEDQFQGQSVFKFIRDLYVINMWFKFEDKIQNTSKVIVFTRNHTDNDDDDDATKNSMSPPPPPPGRGGGDIYLQDPQKTTRLYVYFTLSDANLAETIAVTMQGYHEMLQKIWISYLHCF